MLCCHQDFLLSCVSWHRDAEERVSRQRARRLLHRALAAWTQQLGSSRQMLDSAAQWRQHAAGRTALRAWAALVAARSEAASEFAAFAQTRTLRLLFRGWASAVAFRVAIKRVVERARRVAAGRMLQACAVAWRLVAADLRLQRLCLAAWAAAAGLGRKMRELQARVQQRLLGEGKPAPWRAF